MFMVRAMNKWGYGAFSSTINISASTIPDTPNTLVTSIDASTGNVLITWLAPNARSSTIDKYLIEIADVNQTTWSQVLPGCDGSSFVIMSNLQCSIPMSILTNAPFSYTLGTTIVARVSAHNANGWSGTSTPNTSGATAKTVPAEMSAPLNGNGTSNTQI